MEYQYLTKVKMFLYMVSQFNHAFDAGYKEESEHWQNQIEKKVNGFVVFLKYAATPEQFFNTLNNEQFIHYIATPEGEHVRNLLISNNLFPLELQ